MDSQDPQHIGALFGAMILGVELSEEPAPADSPLGRAQAILAEHGPDALTDEVFTALRDGHPLPAGAIPADGRKGGTPPR
ncbi:hypothetical protein [Streptomyces xinghaiensis]|uniref:hypothetical protein n=1 Tax=Streptomyces xinghaiensis TaxID=1038928 RepID=UPI0003132BE1|nr:hypothetical protein [Streptomyces xinghaiensis]MZE79545.1 hypothetical protein [Streptomyces sp. SID5475]